MEAYIVGHLCMATHINTNTWNHGLENKLLKTDINSPKHKQL